MSYQMMKQTTNARVTPVNNQDLMNSSSHTNTTAIIIPEMEPYPGVEKDLESIQIRKLAAANKASPFETPLESKKFLHVDLSRSSHDYTVSGGMIYQGALDEYLSP